MTLLVTAMAPVAGLIPLVSGTSLVFLALLSGLAARGWRRTDDTRYVLGCAGHGADCRRRVAIRNSCVTGARRPAPNCSRIAYLPQKPCLEYFPVLTVVSSFQRLTSSLQKNVLLRLSHATTLDGVGTPIGTMQALLGHSAPEITREIYLHAIPEEQRRAVESVERLVFGPRLDPSLISNAEVSGTVH